MSRKNGKGRQHSNMLRPSDPDTVQLGIAVHTRFIELCETYRRVVSGVLIPPSHLDSDMLLWRTMMVRFKSGDYRNTDDEKKSLRRVAQWTLDTNNSLRNQPLQTLDLGED